MTSLIFYIFYFVLGAATAYALTEAKWHRRMADGFHALSIMSLASHIPTPDEVAHVFGLKP